MEFNNTPDTFQSMKKDHDTVNIEGDAAALHGDAAKYDEEEKLADFLKYDRPRVEEFDVKKSPNESGRNVEHLSFESEVIDSGVANGTANLDHPDSLVEISSFKHSPETSKHELEDFLAFEKQTISSPSKMIDLDSFPPSKDDHRDSEYNFPKEQIHSEDTDFKSSSVSNSVNELKDVPEPYSCDRVQSFKEDEPTTDIRVDSGSASNDEHSENLGNNSGNSSPSLSPIPQTSVSKTINFDDLEDLPASVEPKNSLVDLSPNVELLIPTPEPESTSPNRTSGVSKESLPGRKEKSGEIGPKELFSKYGLDKWFNPECLNPTVEAYIYWRDPKLSGVVFGSGLVLLLSLAYFSFISVIANTGLGILLCAIVFRIYKDVLQAVQKTPQTHPYSVFLSQDIQLPQEKVSELVDVVILHINACLGELRRLFLVEDMIESLKFALVLWVLTYVGSWFNGLTLVIIGFVALFTLPKVYENNKVQIDQNLALVRVKLEELTTKIKDALPAPLRRKLPEKKE